MRLAFMIILRQIFMGEITQRESIQTFSNKKKEQKMY